MQLTYRDFLSGQRVAGDFNCGQTSPAPMTIERSTSLVVAIGQKLGLMVFITACRFHFFPLSFTTGYDLFFWNKY